MEKILGFDLGTNSVGAALRNGNEFEWFGVTTFKKGVGVGKTGEFSFAAERTKHRSSRRLYNARRYRKWETLKVLIEKEFCPLEESELKTWKNYKKGVGRIFPLNNKSFNNWIKLDFDGDGKPDYTSPYQLRRDLIQNQLDLSKEENRLKIGRALYHIAQRRGFKSSRKGGDKEKSTVHKGGGDTTAIGVNDYIDLIKTHKSLGAAFAYLEDNGTRIRNRYTLRKHYEEEVNFICKVQGLDVEFVNQINNAIFFQRPLRSQKGTIGKCTLEPNKARCPISHPNYEAFRAWQFINNIKYRESGDDDWKQLPHELRKNLFEEKFLQLSNSIKFSIIRKYIEKHAGKKWELNYKKKADKVSVSVCPVSGRLKAVFGEDWESLSINTGRKKKGKNGNERDIIFSIWDVWHTLFSFEDEEYFHEFCKTNWQLTDEQTESLSTLWKNFPIGYANLSLKAINNILPFLEEGLIYTEAVILAKMPEIIGKQLFEDNRDELLSAVRNEIERNRFQKRIVNITNNLISKYYLLQYQDRFGWKDENYNLNEDDRNDILKTVTAHFGEKLWEKKSDEEQQQILKAVEKEYQTFFSDPKKEHRKQPHLLEQIKDFLKENRMVEDESKLDKLYHPSQIETYAPAKRSDDGKLYLDSPAKNNGAFKNPMAMRTLHELRRVVNNLIESEKIDEDTRIVVEIAREMNDSNKRWAIVKYQRDRERENESFANAISQLINEPDFSGSANAESKKDTQKFRLWTEQLENLEEVEKKVSSIESDKKLSVSEKDIKKYRLWKEQDCMCIYTGKIIKLTDLFDSNKVDFEHTIPRSQSFDNSLANQTVAYAWYNRDIKGTKLPVELPNYLEETKDGSAIEPRLKAWKDKIKTLEEQLADWKLKSKYASDKSRKDYAIRQRHLVEFDLKYWRDKLDRFTREDVPTGFKNSQLIDTQIISKYALHYLKTVFRRVDVQKGSVTSEFRKIYGIQEKAEKKDRSKHHHHAIDAAVLTLIPTAAKREEILKKAYGFAEDNRGKQYSEPPFSGFRQSLITDIERTILINNIPSKDQVLTPGKKNVRKRGRLVFLRDKHGNFILDEQGNKIAKEAKGDSVRGQLHQDTFYGKIRIVERDINGKPLRNSSNEWKFKTGDDEFRYVVRKPFETVTNLKDLVDPYLADMIEKQLNGRKLSKAVQEGIYFLDKTGKPVNKIRRVRVFQNVKPITVKSHTYLSNHEHKKHYYAKSGDNYAFGLYESEKGNRDIHSLNVFEASKINSFNHVSNFEELFEKQILIGHKKEIGNLIHVFQTGQKVIFFLKNKEELKDLNNEEISKRLYYIKTLYSSTAGNIQFEHHLEARTDDKLKADFPVEKGFKKTEGHVGFSKFQTDFVAPRLLFKPTKDIFIIEDKDFKFNTDGTINFLF